MPTDATQQNPLWGSWQPSTAGINIPGVPGVGGAPALPPAPAGIPGSVDPYGFGRGKGTGGGLLASNLAETNLQTGLQRNALIPLFSKLLFQYGGDAGKVFEQLMNIGGPFYQRKQQQTFEQGSKAAQDAAGLARQRLQASGAGYTPSGSAAAMFGGMGQAEAGNQEEAFLNNLFQNELLQAQGAQGIASLAQLFNPATLTGQGTTTSIQQPTNTGAEWLTAISSLLPKATFNR